MISGVENDAIDACSTSEGELCETNGVWLIEAERVTVKPVEIAGVSTGLSITRPVPLGGGTRIFHSPRFACVAMAGA